MLLDGYFRIWGSGLAISSWGSVEYSDSMAILMISMVWTLFLIGLILILLMILSFNSEFMQFPIMVICPEIALVCFAGSSESFPS